MVFEGNFEVDRLFERSRLRGEKHVCSTKGVFLKGVDRIARNPKILNAGVKMNVVAIAEMTREEGQGGRGLIYSRKIFIRYHPTCPPPALCDGDGE